MSRLTARCTAWACLVLVALGGLPAGPASAQESPAAERRAEAERLARAGLTASLAARHAEAAAQFEAAYATDPAPEYLYSAARAHQLGGACDQARAAFATLLARPDLTEALRIKAGLYAAELDRPDSPHRCSPARTGPAADQAARMAPPVTVAAEAPSRWHSALPWWVAGGTALAAGVTLWGLAAADQAQLDRHRDPTTGLFRTDEITLPAAREAQASINRHRVAAWACGIVGLAAAGWGVRVALRTPSRLTVTPTATGLMLAGRF